MKKLFFGLLITSLMAGCNLKDLPTEFPTPPPIAPATPLEKMTLKPDAELEKQIAKIAESAKGKVGVAAVLLETGDAAMLNGDQRFPMQSVYKLPISMAVMDQIRRGELALDEKIGVTKEDMVREGQGSPLRDANPNGGEFTIRELIRRALVESDGTASDVLMRIAGGATQIQNFMTQIGIKNMRVANTEKELGQNWQTQYENYATPADAVELLRWLQTSTANANKLHDGDASDNFVEDKSNDEIVRWFMAGSTTGAKRLKANLPPDTVVAHKTGTSGTQNGVTAATNDIGIITLPNGKHVAIAVFVSDSPADQDAREALIAKIAKSAWDTWNPRANNEKDLQVRKIDCVNTVNASDDNLCNFIIPPSSQEDALTLGAFEATVCDVDLNGDGRKEKVVWESSWSGTSGGSLWILAKSGNSYQKLFETDMTWSPIIKLPVKHSGWNDLVYLQTGGGVTPEFITIRNKNGQYKSGEGKSYRMPDGNVERPIGDTLIGKEWQQSYLGPIAK